MNIRTFTSMINRDNSEPISISITYAGAIVCNSYNPLDPFQSAAYGNFKVNTFVAMNYNEYQIDIATTPQNPIIEE